MSKLLTTMFLSFLFASAYAGGDKVKNPMVAATLDDGCVLVFADGIDETQCEKVNIPTQSGQQYICEILAVCGREE